MHSIIMMLTHSLAFCYHDHKAVLLLNLSNEIAAAPTEPEESIYSMLYNNDKVCISYHKFVAAPLNPIQTRPDDGTHIDPLKDRKVW